VKTRELAETRENFGRRRRTPASADADENSGAVMRARCHSDPRMQGLFVQSFGLYLKITAGVVANSAINTATI
jgi:hypothetical protein